MSLESRVEALEATNAQLVTEVVRARDVILALNNLYPTITAGRQEVAVGKYFLVQGAGDTYATLYQKTSASTQDKISEYPSKDAVDGAIIAATNSANAVYDNEESGLEATNVKEALDEIMDKTKPVFSIVDGLRRSVEAQSGGRNTVIYTDKNEPCYMYVFPKFNLEDLPGWDPDDGTGVHPAFLRNSVEKSEIIVGMYQAAQVSTEAVSQPFMAPKISINYDNARLLAQASGEGFDIMSNWEWAAIAMWCMANGYQPRGNSNYGSSHEKKWETGRLVNPSNPLGDTSGSGNNILTGSGPNTWRHDGSPFGIADLVGNVWEWQHGFKAVDGVAHIAPDNDAYDEEEYIDTEFTLAIANPWSSTPNAGAPNILKQALIVPSEMTKPVGSGSLDTSGERLPIRGGSRRNGAYVGLGALTLNSERSDSYGSIGFRLTFRA